MVTTSFPRWEGDNRGTFVLEAAIALAASGHQVEVVAMHSPQARTHERIGAVLVNRPRYLRPERWETLQRESGGLPIVWKQGGWQRLAIIPFAAVHAWKTMQVAARNDIVHAHWSLSAAAALAGRFHHRKPIVATIHGSDVHQIGGMRLVARGTACVLSRVDRVIAVSQFLKESACSLGVPDDKITVIPDGVDTKLFRPSTAQREPILLFVGSLIELKGLDWLLEALPTVLSAHPDHRLVIIGDGPQRRELGVLAAHLGVSRNVNFLGALAPAQVSAWMQRARLLVLPSTVEGLGVVLLEALACGTPCVASNVGGIADVVVPAVGIRVAVGDTGALSRAILHVLDDPVLWGSLSRNARMRAVQSFGWEAVARRLVDEYEDVLYRRGKVRRKKQVGSTVGLS